MKTKSDGTTASNVELSNEDPITGEPGSHPMGTGLGAALGGALAGAVTGTLAGPIGTVVGTVAGGVAGAYAGRAIAENVDPTVETAYWRDAYEDRPYYSDDYSFDDYEPAYRSGWETYEPDLNWRERESDAKSRWEAEGGATTMTWDQAKLAAEDAYGRINERAGNKPR
jgi:hypothetical protein